MSKVYWPMRRKLRYVGDIFVWLVAGLCIVGIIGILMFLVYVDGFTKGTLHGYNQGKLDGASAVCERITFQVQWATNISRDMTTSRHYTPMLANVIKDAEAAAGAYGCNQPVIPGNMFDPRATPDPIALSKPSLPIGSHTPFKKIPN